MPELIYSVKQIYSTFPEKGNFLRLSESYNIPEYQRGYKWTGDSIKELLDDVKKFHDMFIMSENKKQFYCLQNITLCRSNSDVYNVVDGQQRLTTLLLILSYLGEYDLIKNKLKYSIRIETDKFIQEYVLTRKIWDPEIRFVILRKDQYYISKAAEAIDQWFLDMKFGDNSKSFLNTLLNHVKLIVNKLEENEEKIFSSLNGGKVNLDGADLIRAVLMTRASKEKYNSLITDNRISEFRVRMGMELDAINIWWGRKEVSTYFYQLLPSSITKVPGFDDKTFPINLLYMLYFETQSIKGDSFSFKFFEYGKDSNSQLGDDNWEMYDNINRLNSTMKEWFYNDEIYHLLGYLFFNFKQNVTFKDIYSKWESIESKAEFIRVLQKSIFEKLINYDLNSANRILSKNDFWTEFKDDICNIQYDWYKDDEKLFRVLVLLDIINVLQSKSISRLPVEYFRPSNEDKEHILPQTPRYKEVTKKCSEWVTFISNINDADFLGKQLLLSTLKQLPIDSDLADELLSDIQVRLNELGLNSIGNMTLLNLRINRSYGNSDFSRKRLYILDNYSNGAFIRPHTLKVFVKYFAEEKEERNKWDMVDIRKNSTAISNVIELFFKNELAEEII